MARTWKRYERLVAKALGGLRHPVTGRKHEFPDVETANFAVEVKTRKHIPAYLLPNTPAEVRCLSGLAIMWFELFQDILAGLQPPVRPVQVARRAPKYLLAWLSQADVFTKMPLLVIHKNYWRRHQALVVMREDDFSKILGGTYE